jgi:hypothetical protein
MKLGTGIFDKTKSVIYQIVEENVDKDSKQIYNIVKQELPNVPKFVLVSCLEELSNGDENGSRQIRS